MVCLGLEPGAVGCQAQTLNQVWWHPSKVYFLLTLQLIYQITKKLMGDATLKPCFTMHEIKIWAISGIFFNLISSQLNGNFSTNRRILDKFVQGSKSSSCDHYRLIYPPRILLLLSLPPIPYLRLSAIHAEIQDTKDNSRFNIQ